MNISKLFTVGAVFATVVYAGIVSAADERKTYGWGGAGGADLTMFSKDHDNPVSRAGELGFVFGGSATATGHIKFKHFDGTKWVDRMSVDKDGLLIVPSIKTTQINVQSDIWPDYVFKEEYELRPLKDVAEFITQNGRLPGIPSETEVQENGVDLGDMNVKMMEKIEELTLYVIELGKENEKIKYELARMREQ